MPLPYRTKENPFETLLQIDIAQDVEPCTRELIKDINETTPNNAHAFFCLQTIHHHNQGAPIRSNLQRLLEAVVTADNAHIEKIAEITLLLFQKLGTADNSLSVEQTGNFLLYEKVKSSPFTEQTKFKAVIARLASKNQPYEKLKALFVFLTDSLMKNVSDEFISPSATKRRSMLTLEICQKETPAFIYHAFFNALRNLYHHDYALLSSKTITHPYLKKYLSEANITTLIEIQNEVPFHGALHNLISEMKLNIFIAKRINDAQEIQPDFNALITALETHKPYFLFHQAFTPEEKQLLLKTSALITAYNNNNEPDFFEARRGFKIILNGMIISHPKLQTLIDKINCTILPCIRPNLYYGAVMTMTETNIPVSRPADGIPVIENMAPNL